jgi:hypothetical protein
MSYEEQKRTVWSWVSGKKGNDQQLIWIVCNGFLSGGMAAALTCPLDVVKTRLQVDRSSISSFSIINQILKNEGLSAFGKGLIPRVLWIAPGSGIISFPFFSLLICITFYLNIEIAITIVAYEYLHRSFDRRFS